MDADEKKPLLAVGGTQAEATPSAPPIEPPPYEEPSIPGFMFDLKYRLFSLYTHMHTHTAPYAPGSGTTAGLPPPYAAHAPVSEHNETTPRTMCSPPPPPLLDTRVRPESVCSVPGVSKRHPCGTRDTEPCGKVLQLQRGHRESLPITRPTTLETSFAVVLCIAHCSPSAWQKVRPVSMQLLTDLL